MRTENVVAAARLGGPWDIVSLSRRLQGAEYHPDRFVGLIVHVQEGSALVFEDGQVVTTGAHGVEEALTQMEHVRELLGKAGADTTSVEGFQVRNLVVSYDLGSEVSLDQTVLAFPDEDLEYEPERFPGIIARFKEPKVTLLIFKSGKIVATDTGDMPAIEEVLEGFVGALRERELLLSR
jgi:transcription initiation factor TFIID TATA-box-binding protein